MIVHIQLAKTSTISCLMFIDFLTACMKAKIAYINVIIEMPIIRVIDSPEIEENISVKKVPANPLLKPSIKSSHSHFFSVAGFLIV